MRILNSMFNVDDIIRFHRDAENWYKQNFPENAHAFPLIESTCRETFKIYDIVKHFRYGNIDLQVQRVNELVTTGSASIVVFSINKDGRCIDSRLCWTEFDKPLFERVK